MSKRKLVTVLFLYSQEAGTQSGQMLMEEYDGAVHPVCFNEDTLPNRIQILTRADLRRATMEALHDIASSDAEDWIQENTADIHSRIQHLLNPDGKLLWKHADYPNLRIRAVAMELEPHELQLFVQPCEHRNITRRLVPFRPAELGALNLTAPMQPVFKQFVRMRTAALFGYSQFMKTIRILK